MATLRCYFINDDSWLQISSISPAIGQPELRSVVELPVKLVDRWQRLRAELTEVESEIEEIRARQKRSR